MGKVLLMDDFELKQSTNYVKAIDIILLHEDIDQLKDLERYCQHRIKQLEVENEAQAFM
jgi:hypothetical protein